MEKKTLSEKVYIFAKRYNITYVMVKKILCSYVSILEDEIIKGMEVRIYGLFSIVPTKRNTDFISTLAYHSKKVSEDTGITYTTCFTVLHDMIAVMKEDLLSDVGAEIRGVASLKLVGYNGVTKINSRLSEHMKNIAPCDIRIHTSKQLQLFVKRGVKV